MKRSNYLAIGASVCVSGAASVLFADDFATSPAASSVATATPSAPSTLSAATPVINPPTVAFSPATPTHSPALPNSMDALKAMWAAASAPQPVTTLPSQPLAPTATPPAANASPPDANAKLAATLKMASDALAQLKDNPASDATSGTSAQEQAEMASLVQSMKMIQETMASLQASAPAPPITSKEIKDASSGPTTDEIVQAQQMADATIAAATTGAHAVGGSPLKGDKSRTHHSVDEIAHPTSDGASGTRPNHTMDSMF